jgi:D-alanyl-lipoteichoic acid acyltransferase DltB (MBOAT superfamily)
MDVGVKHQKMRHPLMALFMTWAIMGLWHGASWTFVIWGLYHATLIAVYRQISGYTEQLPSALRAWGGWALTLPLVMLGWIPFRAQSISDIGIMLSALFIPKNYLWLGMRENTYLVAAILFVLSCLAYLAQHYRQVIIQANGLARMIIETLIMATVTGCVFVFLRPINQFIYFQF